MIFRRSLLGAGVAATGLLGRAARAATADVPIRLGLLHTLSPAPFYLAQEHGYFAKEGVPVVFRFFESAQPIAAAAVAGDIDVGVTALTGGFFSLAARGALVVIGGGLHERAGLEGSAILVSDAAYKAGLTSVSKLAGHSFAITQYGSSFHYMAGQLATAGKFPLSSLTLRPLQTIPNMLAAVRTGQVDATIAIASMAKPIADRGEVHIIGWIGDVVPYQITAIFTTRTIANQRTDALKRFARGVAAGVAEYRAAFLGPAGTASPERAGAIAAIQRYVFTGDPDGPAKIVDGFGYYDPGAALDAADVANQLHWFAEQGLVREKVTPAEIIDTRFFPQLPARG